MTKAAFAALLLWPLAARAQGEKRWESTPAKPVECTEPMTGDAAVDEALKAITFDVGGEPRPLREVRLEGMKTLDPEEVWRFLGGKPAKPDGLRATAIVRRLASSGLFAQVAPAVSVQGEGVVLTIRLVEQPRLERVVIEGLSEVRPRMLLEALLEKPRERRRRDDDERRPCVELPVPAEWQASVKDDSVHPGIVRQGMRRAVQRMIDRLTDRGFQMATLSAELSPDGTLTVRVEEGRISTLEIHGVSPRIEEQVRQRLELRPGVVYDREDMGAAYRRMRDAFPFLDSDGRGGGRPSRARPTVEEDTAGGVRRYRLVEHEPERHGGSTTIEGNKLTIYLRSRPVQFDVDASEILRHTPVTGFAPGLEVKGRLWDPGNRVHLTVDLGGNVNTHRAVRAQNAVDPLAGNDRWRFDWMVGPKVQIPDARVAEAGVQFYGRVDTADRWRIDRIDSYLYSMIFDRPDSEYFQRQGLTAFLTAHLFDRLTGGVEYRRDRYRSLASPAQKYWTLFHRHEPPRVTPVIDEGTMASMLVRLEFSTAPAPAHKVGVTQRDPERSIVRHGNQYWWTDFHTVNTLEIADPGLGGDHFEFVRVVSDSAAVLLRPSPDQGLKVRFRVAGRMSGTLPVQKQESLGGWTAVRGYGFKEDRNGTLSILGTVEYRIKAGSAFVDVGSLRTTSFGPTRTGLGLALNLGEQVSFQVAWRTDDRAKLVPEARLFVDRTF
ncbi:MAG TPA: hypothetical protein VN914_02050 [Polyangia bacterium]|nr:hypothetical protein [Polyangia bacterium]